MLLRRNIERVRVRARTAPLAERTGAVGVVVSRSGRGELPFAVNASAKTLVAAPVRVAGRRATGSARCGGQDGQDRPGGGLPGVLTCIWRGAAAVVNVIVPDDYVASVVASEIGAECCSKPSEVRR